jgi:uncharacterized protein with HEPN domain
LADRYISFQKRVSGTHSGVNKSLRHGRLFTLPEKYDSSYLWDMLDAAQAIRQFITGHSFEDYLRDRMLRGAVERHLEIIGEAAGKLSKSFRDSHPELPWQKIIGQRHVLIHDYGDIGHELVWAVATIHIPDLIHKLEPLIKHNSATE